MPKKKHEWLLVAAVALLMLVGITAVGSWVNESAASDTPTSTANGSEKIKIFFAGGAEEGQRIIEEKVNAWLKDNGSRVTITGRTQSGDRYTIFITIWYK